MPPDHFSAPTQQSLQPLPKHEQSAYRNPPLMSDAQHQARNTGLNASASILVQALIAMVPFKFLWPKKFDI